MITIYHLSTSRSERVIWLMEELELPYRVERLDRQPNLQAPDHLKSVHPLGRAPIIRDGDVTLAESGAIVDYITRRSGGRMAVGPEAPNFADYLFWLHFAEGSFASQLLREWYLDLLMPDADNNPIVSRVHADSQAQLDFVEARLGVVPYFAGFDFTAADIMMAFPFTTMQRFKQLDLSDRPNIRAYVNRISNRPAYRTAMAAAEPEQPAR
ncbi:glutathione S-transferase family protein [Lichenihabitans psoromatis]|uniref:glutathione S-transferase family protein n=1 Tax=Lichenihabitans psoromatis TaxID=2528642 RepID=UPI0013F17A29|nr:glutathione S-transferase family protein [Lichenihabitans psoromatis]